MTSRLIVSALALMFMLPLFGQTTTMWRGGTDGNYPDTGLLRSWPENGPEIAWVFEGLGDGHSSPVFAHGKIFVSTMIEKTGYIFILDMNGKELKRYPYGEEFFESFPGARSTPVIVDDWLYIYSGLGVIYAMDALQGNVRWKKEMFEATDGQNITWGVTETLVVDGGIVYCSPGGKTNNVVALDRKNGEIIWTNPGLGELSAYCTPLLIKMENRKLLVTMMASHILGFDAESGKLLWNHKQPNQWSVHANTPVYSDGLLVCTSGYGQGTVALNLSADGSSVSKAWFNADVDNRMGGVVLLDGHLYASGDKNRGWRCIEVKTGNEKWFSKDPANGVVISADKLLFIYSDRGELALAEANPNEFQLKSMAKVTHGTAQHWSHPVIQNGLMYLRHGNALIAYKIK